MAEYLEDTRAEAVGAIDHEAALRFVAAAAEESAWRFEDGDTYNRRDGAAAAIGAILQGVVGAQMGAPVELMMTAEQMEAFSGAFELQGPMQVGYAIIDMLAVLLDDPLGEIPTTE